LFGIGSLAWTSDFFLYRPIGGGHGEQDPEHAQRDLLRQDQGHRQRTPVRTALGRGQKDQRPSGTVTETPILVTSVADPDPYVFEPPGPGFGSISTRYGSGSFYIKTKIVRKTLNPTVL
jgi:hypothetical protein